MKTKSSTYLVPSLFASMIAHLLSSALDRTKMWKNGSKNISQQRGKIFTWEPEIWKKMYNKDTLKKHFSSFFRI